MQARPLKDDGCTVVDAPYKEEDLDASKLGVDTSFPVLRSPWLKVASDFVKAPVYSTFITPNSPWLVPMMFGLSPNITGSFRMWKTYLDDSLASCDGAFSFIVEQQKYTGGSESTVPYRGFTFDASRVSATYGDSTVVQPASLCLLPCIRF